MLKRKTTDPAARKFWKGVDLAAKMVAAWPEWKRNYPLTKYCTRPAPRKG